MVEHFAQRQRGVANDWTQLKANVDHYNGAHKDRPAIQLIIDFTDDVAEREALRPSRSRKGEAA
jgi:hypothetical protein